jgi:WD40 repeat protein/serine/threonine protein kinase
MTNIAELLETLRRLHLLEPAQLETVTRQWGHGKLDPRVLAKKLVEQELLTHFQVNQLFKGKGSDLLLGSYVLLDLLGEGGMGAVYKARNWKLGQVVAVKLIRKERLANTNAVKRFRREIRVSAQLEHPNIVHTLDADEVGGTHVLVMEYVDGGQDLHKLVRAEGRLPIDQACRFLQQAAMGLQHAFECGLVHRDIKPHNLLRSLASGHASLARTARTTGAGLVTNNEGLIKILDFGLARLGEADDDSSTLTQEGSVMGTLDYLAPEQARDSHTADIRSDLYSLGCTMYFMLTGQAPFPGGSALEKMYKHQFGEATPLVILRPETPSAVAHIVGKLMAKRPEDRYRAPAELALDLEAFLAGRAVSASATPASKVPPVHSSVVSESLQETHNPFAGFNHSDTAADDSGAVAVATMSAPKAPAANRNRLVLLAGGGAAALVVLIVTLVVVFSRKPPVAQPKIVQPKAEKEPTLNNLLARAEKQAQEEKTAERKRKAEEKAARQKWIAEEEEFRKQRAGDAEEPFKLLETKLKGKNGTFASLAREVAVFKAKHGGTPAAIRAAEMLMRLPSPLDKLDRAMIPEDARETWKAWEYDAKDVVAVLGEHRRRHWGRGRRMTMSADGKVIATVGEDNMICVWDPKDWKRTFAIRPRDRIIAFITLSPRGDLLLEGGSGAGGTPRIWDVAKQRVFRELKSNLQQAVTCGVFSTDGTLVLTGRNSADKGIVQLWDVSTGREQRRLEDGGMLDNTAVAFFPDHERAVSANNDGKIRLWDLASTKLVATLAAHGSVVTSVAVSANGKKIVSTAPFDPESSIRLWDVDSGQATKMQRTSSVANAIFSPDGKHVITSGDSSGAIRVHDLLKKQQIREFAAWHHNQCGIALLPDGKHLVSLTDIGAIRLWDVETGKEVQPLTGPVGAAQSVTFGPNGTRLAAATAGEKARLWDVMASKELSALETHPHTSAASISPDGERIALRHALNLFVLWEPTTNYKGDHHHRGELRATAFSPDGRLIARAHEAAGLDFWDVKKAEPGIHIEGRFQWVALDPSGRIAATAHDDNTLHLYEIATGRKLPTFQEAINVSGPLAFSPDGRSVAAGSSEVSIWNLANGLKRWSVPGYCFAFSPNGQSLAVAQADRIVGYDAATGAKLHEWQLPGPVHTITFAADGHHLATANGNGTVYILRIPDDMLSAKALSEK